MQLLAPPCLAGKACPGHRPESSPPDLRGAGSRPVGGPALLRPPPLRGRWGTAGCSTLGVCGRPSLPRCPSHGALELLGAPAGERPASWLDRWDSRGRDSGRVACGYLRPGVQAVAGDGMCPQAGAARRTSSLETVLFART